MDGLRRIVRALHAGTSASERVVGLSSAQLFVLRQLHTDPEQSLSDLARRTRTTQSSVSEVVARLVKRGLVARDPSATDRRRAVLTLMPAGEALLATAPETVQERLVAGFGRLEPAAQRALAESIERWLAASGLADVAPTFFFEPNESESP
jgi:MarR family transcriptional regulator, lower aerobic nicotinate degradation pathway regulator